MKNKDFFFLLVGVISAFTLPYFLSSCSTKRKIVQQQTKCETIQLKY